MSARRLTLFMASINEALCRHHIQSLSLYDCVISESHSTQKIHQHGCLYRYRPRRTADQHAHEPRPLPHHRRSDRALETRAPHNPGAIVIATRFRRLRHINVIGNKGRALWQLWPEPPRCPATTSALFARRSMCAASTFCVMKCRAGSH